VSTRTLLCSPLLFGLVACGVEPIQLEVGCTTTRDCAPGSVCNAPEALCVPEPTDGLQGTFSCITQDAATSEMPEGAYSDVLGTLAGSRLLFGAVAGCQVDDLGLLVLLADPTQERYLSVRLYVDELDRNRKVTLTPTRGMLVQSTVALSDADSVAVAYSSAGLVQLAADWSPGAQLRGYLEGSFDMVAEGPYAMGADCTTGLLPACGVGEPDSFYSDVCAGVTGGDEQLQYRTCTRPCDTDTDCTSGICYHGFCRLPCSSDTDCPAPTTCDLSEQRGACW
jgi:hypothetical protein